MSVSENPAKSIFLNALEISVEHERRQYIDERCCGNEVLRGEVDRLLSAAKRAADFIESPPDEVGGVPTLDFAPTEKPGGEIGAYRLMEQIGEGGMGVVYVAQQERPIRRRVALKVIKPGMDSKEVISRFEAERQALALMDHPNIAKVYDAGTTPSGLPYFVMELVRGIPITEYCDLGRFDADKRLKIFVQVCQAVQHAHQKGIIHRDIKPSNVLITEHDGTPVVKVIDFGVAKAINQQLTGHTIYTRHRQMVGTPLYMSPEQAELSALDVDTRSDIYSLGVLLYELLTGATPFDKQRINKAAFDEIRRIIREEEPSKPSTKIRTMGNTATAVSGNRSTDPARLCRVLQGDLDWIVMKCLEKDRARRYETANGLVMDLQRHLNDEPVTARPPSISYRLQKAWRRHRAVWITAATVLLAIVSGMSLAAMGWHHARQQRDAAVQAQVGELRQRIRAESNEQQARMERERAITVKENARQRAYAAEMNIAFQADAENNLYRMRELLARQRPESGEKDLRGFEWRYLWKLCQGDQMATFPNEAEVDVCFSADGKLVAFAKGGSATEPGSITIRDAVTRAEIKVLREGATTIEFSPGSDLLAAANYGRTTLWNTSSWEKERTLHGANFPAVFSPDGKWLVTRGDEDYQFWDTQAWEQVAQFGPVSKRRAWHGRHAVAFSPDSRMLCTPVSGKAAGFQLLKIPSLEPLPDLDGPPGSTGSAEFLADGKHLLVGGFDGSIRVWDIASGEFVKTLHEHSAWVTAIDTSVDGKTFATASCDRLIVLWDAATLTPLTSLRGHLAEIWALAMSPDGRLLASGSQHGTAMLWDASTRKTPLEFPGHKRSLGFVGNDRLVVTDSSLGEIQVFDTVRHAIVDRTPIADVTDLSMLTQLIYRPVSSEDRLEFAAGRRDGSVVLSSVGTQQTASWSAFDNPLRELTFSPDGKLLAARSGSNAVKIWSVKDQRELASFDAEVLEPKCLAFSPDSKFLACGGTGSFATVWGVEDSQLKLKLGPHNGFVRAVKFSPDGRILSTGTQQGNEAVLWEITSGRLIAKLQGHLQHVSSIDFTADGKTVATGSGDNRVKLWNVDAQQQITTLLFDGMVTEVRFSPDDRTLAVRYSVGRGQSVLRLIHAATWREIDEIESKSEAIHASSP